MKRLSTTEAGSLLELAHLNREPRRVASVQGTHSTGSWQAALGNKIFRRLYYE
jgi:hypothetical protein